MLSLLRSPFLRWIYWATLATALLSPRWTLLRYPLPGIPSESTDVHLYVADLFLIPLVLSWLWICFIQNHQIELGRKLITWPYLCLVILSVSSILWSIARPLSAQIALRHILLFVLFLITVNEIKSAQSRYVAGLALSGPIFIQSFVAIMQFIGQAPLGLHFLGEQDFGVTVVGSALVEGSGARLIRAYGLSPHPIMLGMALSVALLWFTSQAALDRSKMTSLRWVVAGGVCLVALFFTFSRSAWLGTLVAMMVLVGLLWRKRVAPRSLVVVMLAYLVIVAGLSGIFFNQVAGRMLLSSLISAGPPSPMEQLDLAHRFTLQAAALQAIKEAPILGSGVGTSPVRDKSTVPVQNTPLLVSTEIGVIGGLSWVALGVGSAWGLLRGDYTQDGLVWGAALLGIATASLFTSFPWELEQGRSLWAIVAGLAASGLIKGSPSRSIGG